MKQIQISIVVGALVVLMWVPGSASMGQHLAQGNDPQGNSRTTTVINRLLPLLAQAESSGRSWITARDGKSHGLFQISPCVLKEYNHHHKTDYNISSLYLPALNRKIAKWYLHRLNTWLSRNGYPDDMKRIALAYNWGMGNLRNNNFQIPEWCYSHPNYTYRAIFRNGDLYLQ